MAELKFESKIHVSSNDDARAVFGDLDGFLTLIEEAFEVRVVPRGNEILLAGSATGREAASEVIRRLQGIARRGEELTEREVRSVIASVREGEQDEVAPAVVVTNKGRPVRPKTAGQRRYTAAIASSDIVFGIGPAGTGKTYLAMAAAVAALKERLVERLILTRPAVEAGEKLGFLPGDLQEKVDPYLRPLYDALFDILGVEAFDRYRERGVLEIAPLAYMRGRTLDASFIILDEAQNTTPEQMKMFLTRLGSGSRAVITGDVTQVDLPRGQRSGLVEAREVLQDTPGIDFIELTDRDVVRHALVQRIIQAYAAYDRRPKE